MDNKGVYYQNRLSVDKCSYLIQNDTNKGSQGLNTTLLIHFLIESDLILVYQVIPPQGSSSDSSILWLKKHSVIISNNSAFYP